MFIRKNFLLKAVLALTVLLSACSSANAGGDAALDRNLPKQVISIQDFAFSPEVLTVPAGTQVQWTNKDPVGHSIVFESFSSGMLKKDKAYAHRFGAPGVYEYHCGLHPSMTGTIKVL